MPILSDIDHLFKSLIKILLSTLGDILHEEFLVIVIDALDKYGGLRHDSTGYRDYEFLLHTLKHWIEINYLKKFKFVITSQLEDSITQTFSKSISTHINIPSRNDVKLEDKASDDIHVFLTSKLSRMDIEEAWVTEALDYLVPHAAGMFI